MVLGRPVPALTAAALRARDAGVVARLEDAVRRRPLMSRRRRSDRLVVPSCLPARTGEVSMSDICPTQRPFLIAVEATRDGEGQMPRAGQVVREVGGWWWRGDGGRQQGDRTPSTWKHRHHI